MKSLAFPLVFMAGQFRALAFEMGGKVPYFLRVRHASEASPNPRSLTLRDGESAGANFITDVPMGPPDPILGIVAAFKECKDPNKINLSVGAYRDNSGKPWVLPSVREAEKRMLERGDIKEYAPIGGFPEYVATSLAFAYGDDSIALKEDRIAGVQALSGTGSLRIGAEFFAQYMGEGTPVYISDPTWGNHLNIFAKGGQEVRRYRYFDAATKGLDYDGMMEDLSAAPRGSVVLLHACAHNPSGVDPTPEQWKAISDLCKRLNHVVFFDCAYQGFATGDARKDAFAIRLFVDEGHSLVLAQSYAKNFGLYGERVGCLSIVCKSTEEKDRVNSQLKRVIRPMYSSPPIHGAGIITEVLGCDTLRPQYYDECKMMADRIADMRVLLKKELIATGSSLDWEFVTKQIGMFAYTGMTKEMCEYLMDKKSIFLTKDGRISMAGVNTNNVKTIAAAIHEVTSMSTSKL